MPVERSKIAAVLRSIRVDYFGEAITVTYKPDGMTPAKEAELARLRQEAEDHRNGDGDVSIGDTLAGNAEQLAERLAELLVSWDIVEDGEPLPPTKENLMTFPNALLGHIVTAIGEDLAPKVKTFRR
jgi:hypothetical protein